MLINHYFALRSTMNLFLETIFLTFVDVIILIFYARDIFKLIQIYESQGIIDQEIHDRTLYDIIYLGFIYFMSSYLPWLKWLCISEFHPLVKQQVGKIIYDIAFKPLFPYKNKSYPSIIKEIYEETLAVLERDT